MKLASFPYVVQKEILDHLSINNIFFLSLCSKRTKTFITQLQKCQFQKVEHVIYMIDPETVSTISVKMMSRVVYDLFMGCFKSLAEFAMLLSETEEWAEELQVNVLGTPIVFFRSRTTRYDLQLKYCSDSLESTLEPIHNTLCDVLGQHTKSWFSSTSKTTHFLPMLKNIQMLTLYGGRIDSKRIDQLLSKTSCFQFLSTASRYGSARFKKSSKLFNSEHVIAAKPSPLNTDILKYFNGRNAFFKECDISSHDVVHFLNSWKSGKKFRNLEVMSIDSNSFRIPLIRHAVQFKVINTLSWRLMEPWQFKSNLYLVRESDGHVASVMLTDSQFFMGVWKLTEKQFLERFK